MPQANSRLSNGPRPLPTSRKATQIPNAAPAASCRGLRVRLKISSGKAMMAPLAAA
jgi:hypothetical protein